VAYEFFVNDKGFYSGLFADLDCDDGPVEVSVFALDR